MLINISVDKALNETAISYYATHTLSGTAALVSTFIGILTCLNLQVLLTMTLLSKTHVSSIELSCALRMRISLLCRTCKHFNIPYICLALVKFSSNKRVQNIHI